jgi:pSer/pThr/pTyr-binding forkhead associated (FHA) protein
MESICPICKKTYDGVVCSQCTVTDLDVSGLMASEGLQVESIESGDDAAATAFLVDLVSNRKIPITTPRCKVGRDDLNDIVISGDQSISRFHFVISRENNQYLVQDGKSRHGTFLNGNQISDPEPIHDGDVLKVGVSLFWFVIEAATGTADSNKGPTQMRAGQDLEFMVPSSDEMTVVGKELDATIALPKVTPIEVDASKPEAAESKVESRTDNGKSAPTSKNGKGKSSKAEANRADKNKEFDGETFSADPNSPEQTQSSLLNAISESIQGAGSNSGAAEAALEAAASKEEKEEKEEAAAESNDNDSSKVVSSDATAQPAASKSSAKMEKLRRFDPDSLMNRDEEYGLGNFTFFEPLTAQTAGEEASSADEPVQPLTNASATAEHVPYDAAAFEAETQEQAATVSDSEKSETESDLSVKAESEAADSKETSESSETTEAPVIVSAETSAAVENESNEPAEVTAKDENSAATLDKFAEIVGEASSPGDAKKTDEERLEKEERENLSKVIGEIQPNQNDQESTEAAAISAESSPADQEEKHTNGAKSVMSTVIESSGVVPNWCKKYFSSELGDLGKELTELNEQVKAAQQKIHDVQGRVALTRGLRNVLLSSQGEELVEGCSKVLSLIGWEVKVSDDDKHELRLNCGDKEVCIASIVWTNTQADRTHLAQLSISQTRFWCEQGVEPKGILIVSKASDSEPEQLSSADFNSELAEYAKKKNVCLMTTLQLLSIYKEVALVKGNVDKVRAKMTESSGWLEGFSLEPGEFVEEIEEPVAEEKDGISSNKLSTLLSA